MSKKNISTKLFVLFISFAVGGCYADDAQVVVSDVYVNKSSNYSVDNMFGVHSLFWTTQQDLMDDNGVISDAAIANIKSAGVNVIRNGGGVNEINWKYCIGPNSNRKQQRVVHWTESLRCLFGVDEYNQLNKTLGLSTYWFIANVVGYEFNIADTSELAKNAADYADYVRRGAGSNNIYWELGNELTEGEHRWPAEMVIARATSIGRSILKADPLAKLVTPLISFSPEWVPSDYLYNGAIVSELAASGLKTDYSVHTYYDNPPEGPSVKNRLDKIKQISGIIEYVNSDPDVGVWVTEHSRWPLQQANVAWYKNWNQASNFDAALSTANFMIGLTQTPRVKGAMWNALRGFDWSFIGDSKNNYKLTTIGALFSLLSKDISGYRARTVDTSRLASSKDIYGSQDVNVTAFDNGSCVIVWAVNKGLSESKVSLSVAGDLFKSLSVEEEQHLVSGGSDISDIYSYQIVTNSKPSAINPAELILPARSVVREKLCNTK